jgi:tRNA A-37 threonylcarbamoyl transferase component Bud32
MNATEVRAEIERLSAERRQVRRRLDAIEARLRELHDLLPPELPPARPRPTYCTGPAEPDGRNPLVLYRTLSCERCGVPLGKVVSAAGHVRLSAERVASLWPELREEVTRHHRLCVGAKMKDLGRMKDESEPIPPSSFLLPPSGERPMSVATVVEFIDVLRAHQLLAPDQLAEFDPEFLLRFANVRMFAKYLLARTWLTVYQVNQIFQGNARALVLGPYRVLDVLGAGGVSSVYKAWDTRRKCAVALKALRAEHLDNAEARGRLKRELRAIAQLNHPNVVKAYDVDLVNHCPFFAMEYVAGTDLAKRLQLSGPVPAAEACGYVYQAALGLQHAHELGMVHRDIKPGNLLVTAGGARIKILDMGLARLEMAGTTSEDMERLTMEGVIIGTADYVSPEQAKNPSKVDIRADIYSLGCTFYHLLTGQPPFPGKVVLEKLYKHQCAEPDLAPVLRATGRKELAAVIRKMMAKRPEDRYQTPAEVAEALK